MHIIPAMLEHARLAIRPMTSSDVDNALAIERESFLAPWTREHFLQEIASEISFPLVATREENFIGYVCAASLFEEAQILDIAVAPSHRKKGVGEALLKRAVDIARERGAEVILLEVRESNTAAIKLYEKSGFLRYSTRKKYYEGKEDALLMRKTL